jgi:DNA polymerase-3 subunit epsilon
MLVDTVAVIDFETTGLSPSQGARVTEVAVVVVEDGQIVDRFQSLMNARAWIPSYIEHLTGISNEMIEQAPPAHEIFRDLAVFIGEVPLVAHNAAFDRQFLDAEFGRINKRRKQEFTCSMRVARRVYPHAANHKLGTLVEYADVPVAGRAHRALADAEMTANLWLKMQEEIGQKHQLKEVPLDLMKQLQSIPRYSMDKYVNTYKKRLGI